MVHECRLLDFIEWLSTSSWVGSFATNEVARLCHVRGLGSGDEQDVVGKSGEISTGSHSCEEEHLSVRLARALNPERKKLE